MHAEYCGVKFKNNFFFFFLNPCPLPAYHTALKQSAMKDLRQLHGFTIPEISLCLLEDLLRNYHFPCFSEDTAWGDSFLQHRIFHALLCQASGSKDSFSKDLGQRQFTCHGVAELYRLIVLL